MKQLNKIGNKVKALRSKQGLSQEELAKRAECGRNAISKVENGSPVGTDNLCKITEALNSTILIIDNKELE